MWNAYLIASSIHRAIFAICLLGLFMLWLGSSQNPTSAVVFTIMAIPCLLGLIAPVLLGGWIARGVLFLLALAIYWDPPSSLTFNAEVFAEVWPVMLVAALLSLPELTILIVRWVQFEMKNAQV